MLRLTLGCLSGVTERLLVTVFYNFVVFFGCRGGECVSNKQMSGKQKILCCGVKLFLVACQFLGGKARAHGTLNSGPNSPLAESEQHALRLYGPDVGVWNHTCFILENVRSRDWLVSIR
jgi:hypothetical protein